MRSPLLSSTHMHGRVAFGAACALKCIVWPENTYLAGLRPGRLDVSDAYAASGRRIFFLM